MLTTNSANGPQRHGQADHGAAQSRPSQSATSQSGRDMSGPHTLEEANTSDETLSHAQNSDRFVQQHLCLHKSCERSRAGFAQVADLIIHRQAVHREQSEDDSTQPLSSLSNDTPQSSSHMEARFIQPSLLQDAQAPQSMPYPKSLAKISPRTSLYGETESIGATQTNCRDTSEACPGRQPVDSSEKSTCGGAGTLRTAEALEDLAISPSPTPADDRSESKRKALPRAAMTADAKEFLLGIEAKLEEDQLQVFQQLDKLPKDVLEKYLSSINGRPAPKHDCKSCPKSFPRLSELKLVIPQPSYAVF